MGNVFPDHYFRIRENGALVFRVETEPRTQRTELEQIASVNIKNGEIKPTGNRALGAEDTAAIQSWIAARKAQLSRREIDDILRTVDHLNLTTQWAQSRASDEELEAVTVALLLSMHDLRNVLVRKQSERLEQARPEAG